MNARFAPAAGAATGAFMAADPRSRETVFLADEAATSRLGEDLSLALRAGMVVALSGDLGAGKSTLARALIRALSGDPELEVPSPTYTLVQLYESEPPVAHFDLYRLGDASELAELGFEEAAETGLVLVEWPQRAEGLTRCADVVVRLETTGGGRTATLSGTPDAMAAIRRSLAIRAFLAEAGRGEGRRRRFTGDASSRRYETVEDGGATFVLMDAPRQPDGPPIEDGLPYSRIAHLAEDVTPFVAIARALRAGGFAAPEIHHADLGGGLVLLEHLGSDTLLGPDGRPIPDRYEAAALCLADFHETGWPTEIEATAGVSHLVPAYDRRAMRIEVDLLLSWYVPRMRGSRASADERARFGQVWNGLFDELRAAETSLVLRDFHSPNVIWRGREEGCRRIGLIDFQDATIGPSVYDLASLAQDARVDVAPELEVRLVRAYVARRRERTAGFDVLGFERAYAIMAAQRASKILGIFVRLLERDGKPQYLRHIPRIRTYLKRTLGHPSLAALRSLYEDWGLLDDAAPRPIPASADRTNQ